MAGQGEAKKPRTCAVCSKTATSVCARCKAVNYCSRECQKGSWSEHKKSCQKASASGDVPCPPGCNGQHASHVVHIDEKTHAELSVCLEVVYLISADKQRYIPSKAGNPKAVPYHSVIWSSAEEVEQQRQRWMAGLPLV